MSTTPRRTSAAPTPAAVSASPAKATPSKTPSAGPVEAAPIDEPFPTPVEPSESATTAFADLPSLAPIAAGGPSASLQSQRIMLIAIALVSLIAVGALGGLTVARARR